MVPLAPPLRAVLEIRLEIENGVSAAQAIRSFSRRAVDDSFARELGLWLFAFETGQGLSWPPAAGKPAGEKQSRWLFAQTGAPAFKSPFRKQLVDILTRGLRGEPVLDALADLEESLKTATEEDLDRHLQKLPFISLIPLMLFELPAFLLLLVGPLILDLLSALQAETVFFP